MTQFVDARRLIRQEAVLRTALTAAAMSVVCASMFLGRRPPVYDQLTLVRLGQSNDLPAWRDGIASQALSWLAGRFVSDVALHDALLRCVVACVAIGGVTAALNAARATASVWVLAVAVFVASGVPLLWNSVDVLTVATVAWLVAAALRDRLWLVVAAGVVLTLSRPEMVVGGPILTIGVLWPSRRHIGAYATVVLLLLFSSLASPAAPWDRVTHSFGEHYAELRYNEWSEWRSHLDQDFGAGSSWPGLIAQNPAAYGRYLVLSLAWAGQTLVMSGYGIALALWAWASWRLKHERLTKAAVVYEAANLCIMVTVAYVYPRYLARFLPLALAMTARAHTGHLSRRMTVAVHAALIVLLLWFLPNFAEILAVGELYDN